MKTEDVVWSDSAFAHFLNKERFLSSAGLKFEKKLLIGVLQIGCIEKIAQTHRKKLVMEYFSIWF